jgi:hypothetical protein
MEARNKNAHEGTKTRSEDKEALSKVVVHCADKSHELILQEASTIEKLRVFVPSCEHRHTFRIGAKHLPSPNLILNF